MMIKCGKRSGQVQQLSESLEQATDKVTDRRSDGIVQSRLTP